jgi:purine-binding chemotaxis protein CheW
LALLRERAAQLARRAPQPPDPLDTASVEVLAFEIGGERYAVETAFVVQALPLPPLTALPGVPNYVAGIVPFRGAAVAAVDLRTLLALPLARLAEPGALVMLQGDAIEFALLADAIVGVLRFRRDALVPALPGLELRPGYLIGVAPDRTAILDAGRLLADTAQAADDRQ